MIREGPILLCAALAACGDPAGVDRAGPAEPAPNLDALAARYVELALAFDKHDGDYVDAYFGPPEWQRNADSQPLSLSELRVQTQRSLDAVAAIDADALPELERLRLGMLRKRLRSMRLRIDMADPADGAEPPTFDEESRILFDAVAPDNETAHFQGILDQIDALLPGDEPLPERVERFRQRFVIPKDRLAAVFDAAIAECRRRTLQHIDLPDGESFRIEYVTDKPWSGYNWYEGDYFSLIQINTDLPIFIDRAVDLGCHEGYPGHHTFGVLVERELVEGRDWSEFTVAELYGPRALISEGSANYGVELAFPGDERVTFERDVLFPMAGLDPSLAERYSELGTLLDQLSYTGNEAARDYLNGTITREQAVDWLVSYGLSSVERAEQRTRFFDTYRSYVINYNLGKDLVRAHVEASANADLERRWAEFERLLSTPLTPGDLARR